MGTANREMSGAYQDIWVGDWHTHVCRFSDAVELAMTGTDISGWHDESPANKASFNCRKCKWSKTERLPFEWVPEGVSGATDQATGAVAGTPSPSASPPSASLSASAEGRGVFAIESTPPGAEVYVDGDFVGTTPIAEHSLPAGKHEIELRKKGFAPWKRQLSVSAGARATVAAEMEP